MLKWDTNYGFHKLFLMSSYTSQIIVIFDPNYNCHYHLLSAVPNLQNTLQQGIDIFENIFLKIR